MRKITFCVTLLASVFGIATALAQPSNDLCANATPITCGNSIAFDTTNATQENSTFCGNIATSPEVWFTYTETVIQTLTWTTCDDANFDTRIYVFSGSCGALVCVDGNDDVLECGGFTSSLEMVSTIGTTYYIKVGGLGSSGTGTGNLTLNCSSLGTVKLEQLQFEYFPNPVDDNLLLKGRSNIQSVVVLNMLGQEVMRMTPNTLETEVNMTALSQGSYFVKVSINDASQTIRIIKK